MLELSPLHIVIGYRIRRRALGRVEYSISCRTGGGVISWIYFGLMVNLWQCGLQYGPRREPWEVLHGHMTEYKVCLPAIPNALTPVYIHEAPPEGKRRRMPKGADKDKADCER